MRKALVIIVSLAVIALGVAYFSGWFSSSTTGGSVSNPAPIGGTSGITTQTATPTGTAAPAQTTTTAGATTPQTPAATITAAPTTPEEVRYVAYNFVITDISGSGFSRTVTAEISNTGNEDAHNVRGVVQVLQGGSVIKIDGQDSLTVEVGTLPAHSVITVQQTIKFGLLDGLKIQSNGAEFSVTLYSDEATQSFSEFYQP